MKRSYIPTLCGLLALALTACAMQNPWGNSSVTGTTTTTTVTTTTTTTTSSVTDQKETATEDGATPSTESAASTKKTSVSNSGTSKVTSSGTQKSSTVVATTKPTTSPTASNHADEVLRLVNIEREKVGLNPLLPGSAAAYRAAAIRAAEINTSFSHTRPDGTLFSTVFVDVGMEDEIGGAGENIAYGYTSPTSVMSGWMLSTGHRENILYRSYTHLAVVRDANYRWVQLFYIAR